MPEVVVCAVVELLWGVEGFVGAERGGLRGLLVEIEKDKEVPKSLIRQPGNTVADTFEFRLVGQNLMSFDYHKEHGHITRYPFDNQIHNEDLHNAHNNNIVAADTVYNMSPFDGVRHLQKAYNTNKAALKTQHWVIDPTTGTYNVEKIRLERPENNTASEWDKYIEFWNDPRNIARAAQNRQNRAQSTVISRQGSRTLARLRDEMMQTSTTQEYPSLIDTFFVAHTVNGEFLRDEDRRIYTCFHSLSRVVPAGVAAAGTRRSADHQDDEDEDGDGDA
nr:hypothetical protein [Tanacetum cinerariifolium]